MLALASLASLAALASGHGGHRHGSGDGGLVDEGLVDVGDDSTSSDGRLDEGVEFLVTADGELKMPGRDPLYLEVLGGVSRKFENFGGKVLKNGRGVHGGSGADALLEGNPLLQVAVDTSNGELKNGKKRDERQRITLGKTVKNKNENLPEVPRAMTCSGALSSRWGPCLPCLLCLLFLLFLP